MPVPGMNLSPREVIIDHPAEGLMSRCQNCGLHWTYEEPAPIRDIQMRVTAGEPVPSGQCPDPDCGALCQLLSQPKRSFTTMAYADISTGHMTQEDSQILAMIAEDKNNSLGVSDYECGFLIRLAPVEDLETEEWRREGLSEALCSLMVRCAKEGYQGIQFDCDAEHYDDLPRFEW